MQRWVELVSSDTIELDEVVVRYRSGWQLGPVSATFPVGVSALSAPMVRARRRCLLCSPESNDRGPGRYVVTGNP
ncbi:ABC transporter [Cutibacterium acnes JCM 18920]|nr:ABC transporter [Cutibacterium acnes JCM 18918]GAE80218.1 ABC transporter [Cutibacterium acnes JCM 18920]